MDTITTSVTDPCIKQRRTERGRNPGSTISPATVKKELRHIKAVLRVANAWNYLPIVPKKVRMLRESQKLPPYVTPEHFATIYRACETEVLYVPDVLLKAS